ncbi:hypothetical protein [Paraflavitalea speifideaquila]|uniref:hypothetical protein n=1 Tax=Paraflavitalea speifideaquila TaxID=3076558 RepID=UPI0028EE4CE4|nr:hypothetical protein [Paraflavitalea speifideiaquila]
MKQTVWIISLLLTGILTKAQDQTSFPAGFIGHWYGTLNWYADGSTSAKPVNMELHIQPSKDSAGQYFWHIIYGKATEDNRPYLLKPVDTAKGHWVIDEVNGIVLDQYWKGGKFSGAFSVGNTTIVNSYWLENGQLNLEFFSYPTKPIATTGYGTDDSPKVDSYQIRSYQKAVLHKK